MRREQILDLVSDGRFFGVTFVKRTDGELRRMLCRIGVVSHLTGGSKPYRDEDHNLITVWDAQKLEYRCFPVDGVIELRVNGMVISYPRRLVEYERSVVERMPRAGRAERDQVEVSRIPTQDRTSGREVPRRREGAA